MTPHDRLRALDSVLFKLEGKLRKKNQKLSHNYIKDMYYLAILKKNH